jgi:hypothetical protein
MDDLRLAQILGAYTAGMVGVVLIMKKAGILGWLVNGKKDTELQACPLHPAVEGCIHDVKDNVAKLEQKLDGLDGKLDDTQKLMVEIGTKVNLLVEKKI